MKKAKARF